MNIASGITKACAEKNITLSDLSNRSTVGLNTIKNLVSGKTTNPTLGTIFRICQGANVSLSEFFSMCEE